MSVSCALFFALPLAALWCASWFTLSCSWQIERRKKEPQEEGDSIFVENSCLHLSQHICECGAYRGSTYNKSRGERRKDSCTILCVKKCLYVVGTHVRIGGLGYIPTTSPGGRPGAKNTSHSLEIYGLTHSNVFLLPSSDLSCVLVRKWWGTLKTKCLSEVH